MDSNAPFERQRSNQLKFDKQDATNFMDSLPEKQLSICNDLKKYWIEIVFKLF